MSQESITYTSLPGFVVTASEATQPLWVITVVTAIVIIAVIGSIAWVLWGFHDARLVMILYDISHALKRHLYPLALLEHLINIIQPWN